MLDLKKIKYLCSDTMKPYLDEISIGEDTRTFCEEYIPWLINPSFFEYESLVILNFPQIDNHAVNWKQEIINEGAAVYVEWDSNHIDGLNRYIPNIGIKAQRNVAFFVYNTLKYELKKRYPNYTFQIVLSYDDEFHIFHLRFYRCRDYEPVMVTDANIFISPMLAEII